MNIVKCYIGISQIPNAGLGLFAGQKILKGEIVWENTDFSEMIYSQEQFDALPNQFKENVKKYIYKCNGKYHLNLDDSRHYNHSSKANTTESVYGHYIATKDIEKDEELTCNYAEFNDDKEWLGDILPKFKIVEKVVTAEQKAQLKMKGRNDIDLGVRWDKKIWE